MATNFPTSLDAFTNPTGSDNLNTSVGSRTHSQMHADMNDAMEAVQAAVKTTATRGYLKGYAESQRTSGTISLSSTSVVAVTTTMDLTIPADSGDLIEYGISGLLSAAAAAVTFDVYTMPGGTATNPFSVGLNVGSGLQGVPGWEVTSDANVIRLSGGATRILVSGDVSGGNVVLRLFYYKSGGANRDLYGLTTIPFKVWAKNYGQV